MNKLFTVGKKVKRKIGMGLLAMCLAGCQPDASELTGHWKTNEDGCVLLCGFTLSQDPKTKILRLRFDEEERDELAHMAKGEFRHIRGKEWALVMDEGGKIGFSLEGNKLVAEEGTEFEKLPNIALLNNWN